MVGWSTVVCRCDILLHPGKVTEVDQLHLDGRRPQKQHLQTVVLTVGKTKLLDWWKLTSKLYFWSSSIMVRGKRFFQQTAHIRRVYRVLSMKVLGGMCVSLSVWGWCKQKGHHIKSLLYHVAWVREIYEIPLGFFFFLGVIWSIYNMYCTSCHFFTAKTLSVFSSLFTTVIILVSRD